VSRRQEATNVLSWFREGYVGGMRVSEIHLIGVVDMVPGEKMVGNVRGDRLHGVM